jgi:hypothetical protein
VCPGHPGVTGDPSRKLRQGRVRSLDVRQANSAATVCEFQTILYFLAGLRRGLGGFGSPSALSARRIAISANMTGAPSSAACISIAAAKRHSGRACIAFGSRVINSPASRSVSGHGKSSCRQHPHQGSHEPQQSHRCGQEHPTLYRLHALPSPNPCMKANNHTGQFGPYPLADCSKKNYYSNS